MNQHAESNDSQDFHAEHDPFICEDDAEWLLRTRYGIPIWGTQRVLFLADYRPAPARYRRAVVGDGRIPDGWVEADVLAAAQRFIAECAPQPANLWTHPTVPNRRFRLKPAGIQIAAARREVA